MECMLPLKIELKYGDLIYLNIIKQYDKFYSIVIYIDGIKNLQYLFTIRSINLDMAVFAKSNF